MSSLTPNADARRIYVSVGIAQNDLGQILIAERPAHVFLSGYWEFPGGKIEPGESPHQALIREFNEEVGLIIQDAVPWMNIVALSAWGDGSFVELNVWRITKFTGDAHGKEGQLIRWVSIDDLSRYRFPEANQQIVKALQQR